MVANVLGGSSYWLTKQALGGLSESGVIVVRSLVALAVLLPLSGWGSVRALLRERGGDRYRLLAMAGLGYALPLTLASYGLRYSTASNAALLIGVEPLAIAALGVLVLHEALTRTRAMALLLGCLGATTIVADGIPGFTVGYDPHPFGDALLAVSAATWSIYTIAAKGLLARWPAMTVSTAGLLVSLPLLLPGMTLEAASRSPSGSLWTALAWAAAVGLLVSGLMTVLWNRALQTLDAAELAPFVFLQPLVGVGLGVLAGGEHLSLSAAFGGFLVVAAAFVAARD